MWFFVSFLLVLLLLLKSFTINLDLINPIFYFLFDVNTYLRFFSFVLFFITLFIIWFSFFYIKNYFYYYYFLFLLILFTFSIFLFLISEGNQNIFIFWDFLGLLSFFLVKYYYSLNSIYGSLVTVISNRIGDFFVLYFLITRDWFFSYEFLVVINIFLICSGMTKRAQFPFRGWLVEAMEAPTPVSSLVHRSTLVTAGLFLIMSFDSLGFDLMLYLIFFIGLVGILFSSVLSVLEKDFKKIVAWRTLSQISFCFLIFSLGGYFFAFIHLMSHALFKSLLFLQVGYLNYQKEGNQDLRFNSNFFGYNFIIMQILITVSCLMALFFTSGIISKELILDLINEGLIGFFISLILSLSIFFTFIYSIKIIKYSLSLDFYFYQVSFTFLFNSIILLLLAIIFITFYLENFVQIGRFFSSRAYYWLFFFLFLFFIKLNFNISIIILDFINKFPFSFRVGFFYCIFCRVELFFLNLLRENFLIIIYRNFANIKIYFNIFFVRLLLIGFLFFVIILKRIFFFGIKGN